MKSYYCFAMMVEREIYSDDIITQAVIIVKSHDACQT